MGIIDPGNPEFVHTNTLLSIAVQKFIFETKRFPRWYNASIRGNVQKKVYLWTNHDDDYPN